jgi:hypothetical protein
MDYDHSYNADIGRSAFDLGAMVSHRRSKATARAVEFDPAAAARRW